MVEHPSYLIDESDDGDRRFGTVFQSVLIKSLQNTHLSGHIVPIRKRREPLRAQRPVVRESSASHVCASSRVLTKTGTRTMHQRSHGFTTSFVPLDLHVLLLEQNRSRIEPKGLIEALYKLPKTKTQALAYTRVRNTPLCAPSCGER